MFSVQSGVVQTENSLPRAGGAHGKKAQCRRLQPTENGVAMTATKSVVAFCPAQATLQDMYNQTVLSGFARAKLPPVRILRRCRITKPACCLPPGKQSNASVRLGGAKRMCFHIFIFNPKAEQIGARHYEYGEIHRAPPETSCAIPAANQAHLVFVSTRWIRTNQVKLAEDMAVVLGGGTSAAK